jgi:hypothetical protein
MTKTINNFTIELIDIDELKPSERNAKNHPDHEVEKLAKALHEYGGLDQPIVVDFEMEIIKGHGRRLATLHNVANRGWSKKVPVIVRRDLTKDEADAARLADNQNIGDSYDQAKIKEEMLRLKDLPVDLTAIGFDEKELVFLTNEGALAEMSDDVFVEDIGEAVEQQKTENKETEAAVDKTAAPIADAFGFKRCTVDQSRQIRTFMSKIEADTGKTGVEALLEHLATMGYV